jgi:hypothetical protein
MVESGKERLKKFIWASSARNGSFGVFFEKKGVKLAPDMFAPNMFAHGTCSCPSILPIRAHLPVVAHRVRT